MPDISRLEKKDIDKNLRKLFELLSLNMDIIDPTGDPPEEDYRIWKDHILSEIEKPEREILLLKQNDDIVGYFQYSLRDTVFIMEEIQFHPSIWGSGAFRELYRFLAGIIPENMTTVEAYANKKNLRSQAILEHLGLKISGENKSGRSWHYTGDCREMLNKYR